MLRLPTLRPQYPYAMTDQGFSLRGRPFNVSVAWNVMPRVGALYTRRRTFTGACVCVGGGLWVFSQGWKRCSRWMAGAGVPPRCWLVRSSSSGPHRYVPTTHPMGPHTALHPPPAGFQLPADYQTPALGKVRRPGSDVIEDIPTSPQDEEEVPTYYEEVEVEA